MSEVIDKNTLKALNAKTRQNIVKHLSKRPYTASELSKILNKHVTTVSEHLDTLEKSGLINKKDSGNKWKYYALSSKGEKIFKPFYYSWVIVISLSAICLFVGIDKILATRQLYTGAMQAAKDTVEVLGEATPRAANDAWTATSVAADTGLIIGIILICLAVIGFSYVIIRKLRSS